MEGGELCERRKDGKLQPNEGWKWEVGTRRGPAEIWYHMDHKLHDTSQQVNHSINKERMKCKGYGRSILKICIIQILRNRWQSICVAFMGFGEVTTFREEPIGRAEIEVRVGKLKNGKAGGKDEITE